MGGGAIVNVFLILDETGDVSQLVSHRWVSIHTYIYIYMNIYIFLDSIYCSQDVAAKGAGGRVGACNS